MAKYRGKKQKKKTKTKCEKRTGYHSFKPDPDPKFSIVKPRMSGKEQKEDKSRKEKTEKKNKNKKREFGSTQVCAFAPFGHE